MTHPIANAFLAVLTLVCITGAQDAVTHNIGTTTDILDTTTEIPTTLSNNDFLTTLEAETTTEQYDGTTQSVTDEILPPFTTIVPPATTIETAFKTNYDDVYDYGDRKPVEEPPFIKKYWPTVGKKIWGLKGFLVPDLHSYEVKSDLEERVSSRRNFEYGTDDDVDEKTSTDMADSQITDQLEFTPYHAYHSDDSSLIEEDIVKQDNKHSKDDHSDEDEE